MTKQLGSSGFSLANSAAKEVEEEATASLPEKNNLLSQHGAISWFKKRHGKTARDQYLKTRQELQQDREIKDVFTKIDYDYSGRVDVSELHQMFQSNGIEMSLKEIECFFDLCKTESKGYLNFDEFRALYKNPSADQLFRYFIKRARSMNQELQGEGVKCIYLPFNLSRLLEHMSLKQRR